MFIQYTIFYIVYLLDSVDNFKWLICGSLFCSLAMLFSKYLTLSSVWYVIFNILTSLHFFIQFLYYVFNSVSNYFLYSLLIWQFSLHFIFYCSTLIHTTFYWSIVYLLEQYFILHYYILLRQHRTIYAFIECARKIST